jgi:hypothetical protein
MIAHVAGAPLEELLLPLVAGGTALAVAANVAFRNAIRRGRRGRRKWSNPPAGPVRPDRRLRS